MAARPLPRMAAGEEEDRKEIVQVAKPEKVKVSFRCHHRMTASRAVACYAALCCGLATCTDLSRLSGDTAGASSG